MGIWGSLCGRDESGPGRVVDYLARGTAATVSFRKMVECLVESWVDKEYSFGFGLGDASAVKSVLGFGRAEAYAHAS